MEQLNNWKYCETTTKNHPKVRNFMTCLERIDVVTKREGAKKSPFNNELCLNLDKMEGTIAQRQNRSKNKTMDISFCIKSGNISQALMCEYKLNIKNPNNLRKRELDEKVKYSINLLGHNPVIHKSNIFIFPTKIKNQAYSILRRLYSYKEIAIALDLNELKSKYFA